MRLSVYQDTSLNIKASEVREDWASIRISWPGGFVGFPLTEKELQQHMEDCEAALKKMRKAADDKLNERIAKMDPEGDFVRDELKGNFKPVKP